MTEAKRPEKWGWTEADIKALWGNPQMLSVEKLNGLANLALGGFKVTALEDSLAEAEQVAVNANLASHTAMKNWKQKAMDADSHAATLELSLKQAREAAFQILQNVSWGFCKFCMAEIQGTRDDCHTDECPLKALFGPTPTLAAEIHKARVDAVKMTLRKWSNVSDANMGVAFENVMANLKALSRHEAAHTKEEP